MARKYKIAELQDIFIGLTFLLRGLDPSKTADSDRVRLAYQTNSAPFQDISSGVVYVWINYQEVDTNKQVNEEYRKRVEGGFIVKRSQLRTITVHWIFYGDDDIQDIAYEFRNKLFSYQAKEYLDNYDIKLILEVPEVVFVSENVSNQWWSRNELDVDYYLETELEEEIPEYSALDVNIITDESENLNCEIDIEELEVDYGE